MCSLCDSILVLGQLPPLHSCVYAWWLNTHLSNMCAGNCILRMCSPIVGCYAPAPGASVQVTDWLANGFLCFFLGFDMRRFRCRWCLQLMFEFAAGVCCVCCQRCCCVCVFVLSLLLCVCVVCTAFAVHVCVCVCVCVSCFR